MRLESVDFKLPPEAIWGLIPELKYYAPQPRTPGIHLSTIIKDIPRVKKQYKTAYAAPVYGDTQAEAAAAVAENARRQAYFEAGFAWELVMDAAFRSRFLKSFCDAGQMIWQPEVVLDNIWMTGDMIDPTDWRYVEMKWTTRSERRVDELEENFLDWFMQLKANCLGNNTNKAALFVMFACGNYKPPVPSPRGWKIEFSDNELLDNWTEIKNHRDKMVSMGRFPTAVLK